jgi:ElaB/YqjD/DUF883 family membrane-anchored ribosome-binding protein
MAWKLTANSTSHMNPNEPLQAATTEANTATDAATQAWKTTKEKAGDALQTGERYVRENPGTSALSIFGFGLLIGLLLGWGLAHDEDNYSTRSRKFMRRWGHKLNLD